MPRHSGHVTLAQALAEVREDFFQARMTSASLRGVPSGWGYLDDHTNGWINGDLATLVGRPGTGKTWLLIYNAYCAWLAGYKVLVVSNELAALQFGRRMLGMQTKINPRIISKGQLSTSMQQYFLENIQAMDNGVAFDIIVGGFRSSVETVSAFTKELGPDIVLVDAAYLLKPEQNASRSSNGRRETVADTIEALKRLALDENRPIVQTVQFNRSARKIARNDDQEERGNPLSHLSLDKIGETDVIGQASSIVLGIDQYEAPYERTRRWVGLLKGREGESGIFAINYRHQPVDFNVLHTGYGRNIRTTAQMEDNAVDTEFMV